jgi:hypothetical protein
MLYNRKTFFVLSLGLLLIFSAKNSLAQFPGMNRVYSNMARQNANQQMRMQMQMNTNWRFGAGKGTTYQVTFKDSSVKQVVSFMYTDTVLHKNFIVFVDKKFPKSDTVHRNQKIYTDQTLYISTNRDIQSDKPIYGMPNDSCWMFTVIGGPLTVYARSMDYLITLSTFVPSDELNIPTIIGIQLNDGLILPFNADNLKNMVGQNARALELIADKKYLRAIKRYNKDNEKSDEK